MNYTSIILIALGLSMDCFAVAVSNGISVKCLKVGLALKIALFFGFFQAIMPVLGWLIGYNVRVYIENYSNFIAFLILFLIGLKMIYESVKIKDEQSCFNCADIRVLLLLSLATSIDAFAVGFSFSLLTVSIIIPVIIIGVTAFFVTVAGLKIGQKIGHFFESRIEIAGGFILILIAFKILLNY